MPETVPEPPRDVVETPGVRVIQAMRRAALRTIWHVTRGGHLSEKYLGRLDGSRRYVDGRATEAAAPKKLRVAKQRKDFPRARCSRA